jgi:hypothetical protein
VKKIGGMKRLLEFLVESGERSRNLLVESTGSLLGDLHFHILHHIHHTLVVYVVLLVLGDERNEVDSVVAVELEIELH